MAVMTEKELKLFKKICGFTQEQLVDYSYRLLIKTYGINHIKRMGSCICAEGEIPIALVAHMDTVFPKPPTDFYYDEARNTMWSPDGLGADDRAGVYAIFRILAEGFRPHVILTTDEEIGGVGSSKLANFPCPFSNLKFLIQLDRKGKEDCVFYECDNKDFQQYIESFGFVTDLGSFTDIVNLSDAWKLCSVNLSVGYENEHTKHEYLNFEYLFYTIRKVIKLLTQEAWPDFEWIAAPIYLNSLEYDICDDCLQQYPYNDLVLFVNAKGEEKIICKNCLSKYKKIKLCKTCSAYYEPGPNDNDECLLCQQTKQGVITHGFN